MAITVERDPMLRMIDHADAGQIVAAAGGTLVPPTIHREAIARSARVITTKPQLPISDLELRARIQWSHKVSPHFQLAYDRMAFPDTRAANLDESLEQAYSLIFHFTHESFTDRFQVYAVDQRATGLLGRSVKSHFNLEERAIYLVESSSQQVHAELVELLTHAMRINRYARHYEQTPGWAVLEEGFSIFLSERLAMQPDVFPFYGAEADVVAHHLYRTHSERLPEIWNVSPNTLAMNQRVLAGAFILYLGDTFSDDRVVTFSKSDYAITSETFRTFFGGSLADLEAAWHQHLPISLLALTEAEQEVMLQHWDRAIECKRH